MKTTGSHSLVFLATGLLLILACTGCETMSGRSGGPVAEAGGVNASVKDSARAEVLFTPSPSDDKPQEPSYFVHTVKWRGESMVAIAAWYTGSTRNWKLLAKENRQIKNPNLITEGDTIRIPENLLKTREPMPREYLDKLKGRSKKPK